MNEVDNKITKEDVLSVANSIGITDLSESEINSILEDYPSYLEDYPNENWAYIVEIMLCDL